MDIGKLQLFSDIAQTKNLSDSAQRMGYTQSGIASLGDKNITSINLKKKWGLHF